MVERSLLASALSEVRARAFDAGPVFIAPHILSGGGISASDSLSPDLTAFLNKPVLEPRQIREQIQQNAEAKLASWGISVGPEVKI